MKQKYQYPPKLYQPMLQYNLHLNRQTFLLHNGQTKALDAIMFEAP